ncbi:DUF732 domain-containing protein [Corynebacterium choanae]|uniref:DUF732 domain-containing protein n=1 Tax=Corynebacterium choanae TaxID=1862358 RepID=A0A3G6J3A0_9CORY|nr:DUF732 domain-containing protein [Corynebacterium choanae]AZA12551.1 hypothetical protein CCHOA_00610 [Corynebacterium choanae]
MNHRNLRRASASIAGLVALTLLAAGCSDSATSVDDKASSTVAPLPRETVSSSTTTSAQGQPTTTTSTSDKDIPAAARVTTPRQRAEEDQGAKEVGTVPTPGPARTSADETYLAAIADAGVSIDGIEDQLIGAAVEYCRAQAAREPDIALPAVAGQLVTQERTTLNPDQAAQAIASAATAAYCRTP